MKAVQEKKKNKAANFVIQGSILAMAGILVRIIGMLYRMPLNDIIGKQGNGYYTSAYNVYNILLILSSYSMPVAISKMISARIAKGEYENCRRILKAGLFYATVTGGLAAFVLWFGSDFFAGLIFHRVIPGFMIQGGGYTKDFKEKHCDSIKGEFKSNGVNNELKHTEGVLSMARTMIKDSASSQFFIMHKPAPHLDGEYAAFGKITEGLDIVDQIANVPTNFQDCPTTPVVIKTIRRV